MGYWYDILTSAVIFELGDITLIQWVAPGSIAFVIVIRIIIISIFLCGGSGINIILKLEKEQGKNLNTRELQGKDREINLGRSATTLFSFSIGVDTVTYVVILFTFVACAVKYFKSCVLHYRYYACGDSTLKLVMVRNAKYFQALSKKKLKRRISSVTSDMSSIRGEYENDEESHVDKKWKKLLSGKT